MLAGVLAVVMLLTMAPMGALATPAEPPGVEALGGDCPVVASGTIGAGGAPWTLCATGTVTVGAGVVNWSGTRGFAGLGTFISPWNAVRGSVHRIEFIGPITAGPNMTDLFARLPLLTTIEGLENIDTSTVTTMSGMFFDAQRLANLDLSDFDTSNVTDMSWMFYGTRALTSLDLANFDTSNVTDMKSMFDMDGGAGALTSLDQSGFDTSNVTNMSRMFSRLENLTSLNLSSFDTSKVTDMSWMFSTTRALTSLYLSSFDTSNVTNMRNMFSNANALTNLDVSSFNTSNVTDMREMFIGTSALTNLDVSSFDTHNVTDMSSMFSYARALTSLDLSGFDTHNVTDMRSMFSHTNALTSLELSSSFDTRNVTNMSSMFNGAAALTSLDVSGFDTSNVTNMVSMFSGTAALTSLDVSGFDTRNVTSMGNMFRNARALTNLDLSNFDTRNVRLMSNMFDAAFALESLDLSSFDTHNVTNMSNMFRDTIALTNLTLSSGFDTSNVTNMSNMFWRANALTSLNLSSFDTRNVTNMNNMLTLTSSLRELTLGEHFAFAGTPGLPAIPNSTNFTGVWQNLGPGQIQNPLGAFEFTSAELMANYDGATMADTWVWQPRVRVMPITVTLNANGGTVSPASVDRTPGTAIGTLPTPTRSGYAFVGWFTDETGGTQITANTIAPNSNVTYWARWEVRLTTVTWDANGGTVNPTSAAITAGTPLGRLPVPTRAYPFAFIGWFTEPAGGTRISASTVVPDSDVTYYARWTDPLVHLNMWHPSPTIPLQPLTFHFSFPDIPSLHASWQAGVDAGIEGWNRSDTPIQIVTDPNSFNTVTAGNYATSWQGLITMRGVIMDGVITQMNFAIQLNHFAVNMSPNSSVERVMSHELGHAVGLRDGGGVHGPYLGGGPEGSVMNNSQLAPKEPTSFDVANVNWLYR